MLYMVFRLGEDRYTLEARHVEEIVPVPRLEPVHGAPAHVVGIFNYRGRVIPVVDLCRMATGTACQRLLSTRILVVRDPTAPEGEERLLGLMAEKVTEAVQKDVASYAPTGLRLDLAFDLGELALSDGQTLRSLRLERLLKERLDGDELAAIATGDGDG